MCRGINIVLSNFMSEFNSEPIDIIIPWVNYNDPVWKSEFEYWKQKETGNKDACRYRDWGFIKCVFRSIEENCPWCRYVFLVLSGPSQIPDWLNVKHPKLKIVYHKDYIPEEFLPTFNSNVIELFYSNIEELSQNFILINDDMFFIQKKTEDFFFKNNIPVVENSTYSYFGNDRFQNTLKNTKNKSNEILKINTNYIYFGNHLPICYNKSLHLFIRYKSDLTYFCNNKFRKNNDLTHFLFLDIQNKMNKCIMTKNSRGILYDTKIKHKINFNVPMICVEEGENSSATAIIYAYSQLEKFFNKKSSFEI